MPSHEIKSVKNLEGLCNWLNESFPVQPVELVGKLITVDEKKEGAYAVALLDCEGEVSVYLSGKVYREFNEVLEPTDTHARVEGSVKFKFKKLQVAATSIKPFSAADEIRAEMETYMEYLRANSTIDANKYITPVEPIRKVGVVCSSTGGAGKGDTEGILRNLSDIQTSYLQVRMLGKDAPSEVAAKITQAANDNDIVLVCRGGGGIDEFSTFDHKVVVDAINSAIVPVITGIGHVENKTFADRVAHRDQGTPSLAAKWVEERVHRQRRKLYQQQEAQRRARTESRSELRPTLPPPKQRRNVLPIVLGAGILVLVALYVLFVD